MMVRQFSLLAFCFAWSLLVTSLCGCEGRNLITVTGTVTLNGKPLEKGMISLMPADGQGTTAGTVLENGQYTVETSPGEKRVEIRGYKKIGERRDDPLDPQSPIMPVEEQIVPERYNDLTELTCTVSKDNRQIDFPLTSP